MSYKCLTTRAESFRQKNSPAKKKLCLARIQRLYDLPDPYFKNSGNFELCIPAFRCKIPRRKPKVNPKHIVQSSILWKRKTYPKESSAHPHSLYIFYTPPQLLSSPNRWNLRKPESLKTWPRAPPNPKQFFTCFQCPNLLVDPNLPLHFCFPFFWPLKENSCI